MKILNLYLVVMFSFLLTYCTKEDESSSPVKDINNVEEKLPNPIRDITITLIAKGDTSFTEGDDITLNYDVVLSKSLDNDITLFFKFKENKESYTNLLEMPPVKILKGQTKGMLSIKSKKKLDWQNELTKDMNFTIILHSYKGIIKNNIALNSDKYMISVKKEIDVSPLTKAQKSLISNYKSKGLDVERWIGKLKVETKVEATGVNANAPFDKAETKEYKTGFVNITLSEKATLDKPLLKMTHNAFGLSEYLEYVFMNETILNQTWLGYPDAQKVLTALGDDKKNKWANKEYPFDVSVDSIEIKSDNTITFIYDKGAYFAGSNFVDKWPDRPDIDNTSFQGIYMGNMISAVDFKYSVPLWEDLVTLSSDHTIKQAIEGSGSIYPNSYIGFRDVTNDARPGGTNWISPEGKIENDKMTFVFNLDHTSSGDDYDKVTVTITPKM